MKCYINRDYVENFVRYHKKTIIKVAAGIMLFAAAFFVFCIRDYELKGKDFQLIDAVDVEGQLLADEGGEPDTKEDDGKQVEVDNNAPEKIFIDIGGAVKKPYVYEMEEGARVFEAIERAGGLEENADISNLNLAQVLSDQDKIIVSFKGENPQGIENTNVGNNKPPAVTNAAKASEAVAAGTSQGLININTATEAELQTINGIGPSTAEKILSYRNENGNFKKIEDLMKVSGIGEKTFIKYKNKITV